VLPLALAYLTALLEEGLSHVRPTLRDRLLWMGSPAGGRAWLLGLAVAVMALSLLLSQSRSGPAALALAVAGAAAAVARRSGRWRRTIPVVMALAALGALLVIWAGAQTGLARMGDVSTEIGGRLSAWGDALRIVAAFPVFGTGLNTYGAASLLYQTTSLTAHYREAHNDYLQLAAEGGVWLGIPILFAAWQFVRLARARFQARHATPARYWLRAGAVTALVAIALQSLVEFSLQMPGNAALFAVVAALAIYTERETAAPENDMVARHRATRGHR
jgi:O-antigen ligase